MATRCDHPNHGTDNPWHADYGTPHNVHLDAPCGHYGDTVATVCEQWVRTIRGFECPTCGAAYGTEILTILGPVA